MIQSSAATIIFPASVAMSMSRLWTSLRRLVCMARMASKSKAADESDAELAGTTGVVDSMDEVGLDDSDESVC